MSADGIAAIAPIASLYEGDEGAHVHLPASAIGHLARIMGEAHTWQELMVLLEKADVKEPRRRGKSKRDFIYGALARLQGSGGHGGITRILEAACGPQAGKKGARGEVNECLRPYGVRLDEGGKAVRVGRIAPPEPDAQAFDQRRYHRLVKAHARAKFTRGDYTGSVEECYKWLEKEIRRRSGLGLHGKSLMTTSLGDAGPLEMSLPHLMPLTQKDVTEGLMHLCAGVSLNVRNPMTHETDEDLAMTRAEALDRLTVMSYIFGQLEKTARRRGARRSPPGGRKRDAGEGGIKGKHAHKSTRDRARGESHSGQGGEGELSAAELVVRPESVERGGTVVVTVAGRGIGGWHVGVTSEGGRTMSRQSTLEANGPPGGMDGGRARYEIRVKTINYAPGEYRVRVSSSKTADVAGTRIKRFTVTNYAEMRAAANEKAYRNFVNVLNKKRLT